MVSGSSIYFKIVPGVSGRSRDFKRVLEVPGSLLSSCGFREFQEIFRFLGFSKLR